MNTVTRYLERTCFLSMKMEILLPPPSYILVAGVKVIEVGNRKSLKKYKIGIEIRKLKKRKIY